MLTLLSELPIPLLVLDVHQRVVFSTLHARGLIERDTLLSSEAGHPGTGRILISADQLGDALRRLASRPARGDKAAEFVCLRSGAGGQTGLLALVVCPVPLCAALGIDWGALGYFLHWQAICSGKRARLMAEFGLSNAEAAASAGLATGMTVAEYAVSTGLSRDSVRTLLKRSYAKTNVAGQAQLVSRILPRLLLL